METRHKSRKKSCNRGFITVSAQIHFFLTDFISHYFNSYILGRRLFVSVYVHVSVYLYMCVEGRIENCPRKDTSVL